MGREQITVELTDHMGSDLSVVNSARVSFSKRSEFEDGKDQHEIDLINAMLREIADRNDWYEPEYLCGDLKDDDKRLVKYLADHRHMTPFRHNAIELRCSAPIFLVRQLGKHQAGLSWNEVSRRYVSDAPDFFMPDEWRSKPTGSIKQGSGNRHYNNYQLSKEYKRFIQLAHSGYNAMIADGVAPEMARMCLPQSMMTEWVWTGNLLSFAHVYKERIAEGAQEEAKWFAEELDKQIRPLFPIAWSALVD